jgi:multidrug efflux pump subunit AcrA (membrane-fusion protein)
MGIKVTFLGDAPSSKEIAATPAILIPQSAVRDDNGKKVVFLLKDDKAERRAVTLGGNRGTEIEVTAGLGLGDSVIVGPANLHDGESVRIKK